jgi:hypothetical protein
LDETGNYRRRKTRKFTSMWKLKTYSEQIPGSKRLRQEDNEFEASLGYIKTLSHKKREKGWDALGM